MSDATIDRLAGYVIGLLSLVILAVLAFILLIRAPDVGGSAFGFLPRVNASLNALSAVLILFGYWAIKQRKVRAHLFFMLSALGTSTLFFVSYLVYHYAHGDTPYTGLGTARYVYFFILISHILTSIAIVPLIMVTLYLALRRRFDLHRRLARVTFPLWLYVSITGVVVFWMLERAKLG